MSIFDKLRAGIVTASAEESRQAAAELAKALRQDAVLALHGDLGVGKTTFVQGLAHGLGIEDTVTSPTFNIFTLYRATRQAAAPDTASDVQETSRARASAAPTANLLHLDAYRLESAADLDALMIEDFLVSPYCLAIEWPERIAEWIPPHALHLDLGILPDERHTVKLHE